MSSSIGHPGSGRHAAPARPGRRAFWADARFLIGVLLVAASTAGVWFVVAASRQTVSVLAAADTLVPGQPVTAADVTVVDVALGQARDAYLAPDALGEGLVALRTIEVGELVPAAGVGESELSDRTSVVVQSSVDVPAGLDRGALVELWETPAADPADPGVFAEPRILVADAVVARITRDDGVMAAGGASLELVIERSRVADVLAAVAAGAVLSAVPTAGGAVPDPAPDRAEGPAADDDAPDPEPGGDDQEPGG
ncbi:SAF domain-containing protein [Microbacterium sp. Root53]|uniref:SAF domain-containing protein n=1 Tax=Microbacterium sp. Root53 TaxID=1736553 RepID=UPI000A7044A0|nr:SAF domain-containing protein [Microbacterium sp. Root53]